MTEFEDPLGPLDPNFAENFRRDMRRPACQLYLVSPLDVGGDFPDAWCAPWMLAPWPRSSSV